MGNRGGENLPGERKRVEERVFALQRWGCFKIIGISLLGSKCDRALERGELGLSFMQMFLGLGNPKNV